MNYYTEDYCKAILNEKNTNYIFIRIDKGEKASQNRCVFSCGNPEHNLLSVRCQGLKRINKPCKMCENDSIIAEREGVIKALFLGTKYVLDEIECGSMNKKEQFVNFHDNDGYKYRMCYRTLVNVNFNNPHINNSISLVSPSNSNSFENIKLWIMNNCNNSKFVSGEYVDNKSPLILRCMKCGKEYVSCWNSILVGRECNLCCDNIKKTNDEFLKQVENQVGDEYTFLEEYKGTRVNIKIRHNLCGHEYSVRPIQFLNRNQRCPKCAGTMTILEDEFNKRLYEKHKNKYSLIGEYNGWKKFCDFRCNDCGNIMSKEPKILCSEINGCGKCYYETLKLSGNPAYVDGSTGIFNFLRKATNDWRVRNFIYYNKCFISGDSNNKEVHHANISFKEVVNRCHKELNIKRRKSINNYTELELSSLKELCQKIHNEEVVGVVLSKRMHKEFHEIYGNWNNNLEQFIEFSKNNGRDFTEVLSNYSISNVA